MGHPADSRRAVQLMLVLAAAVAAAEPPPQALAGLPVATLDGRPARLEQYASRVTVIALWAHWCKPCLAELPMLDALHRKHLGDGAVTVVAVNVDAPEAEARARAIVAGLHLSLPVVLDTRGQVRRRVNALLGRAEAAPLALPQTVLLDPEGRVSAERGLQLGISEAEFVAAKERLIERALRGDVVPAEVAIPRLMPTGDGVRLSGQPLSAEQIARQLPVVRQALARTFPSVSSEGMGAMLRAAEDAMRAGRTVDLSPPR